jgi:amino acid transporter
VPAPPTPPEEVIEEPAGPEAPTESVTTFLGFDPAEVAELEAQTGNVFRDIANGNVPRGSFFAKGAWSLLSLLLSLIAVIIAVLLIAGTTGKRRKDDEIDAYRDDDEDRKKKGRILKVLAVIAGILTPVIWLILDDLSQPIAWINQWTLIVGIVFIVHLVLFFSYKAGNKDEDREDETEYL